MSVLKKIVLGALGVLGVSIVGGGGYVYSQLSAFDASLEKVYDVAPIDLKRSDDPAIIARGKHLAGSLTGCALADCHGSDLGGGKVIDVGPIGVIAGPNITSILPAYSDGELARLIRHGVKKDGKSLRFMPVWEFNWVPDEDLVAVISYLRSAPAVDRPSTPMKIGPLGKFLDRREAFELDVARRVDHAKLDIATVTATPTADYGAYIARMCKGCHGKTLAGGPIPGAPPEMPIPLNLTPHETGLKGWTFEDFTKLATTGIGKNGKKVLDFMPIEAINNMDELERRAIFAYLQSVPPKPFGER